MNRDLAWLNEPDVATSTILPVVRLRLSHCELSMRHLANRDKILFIVKPYGSNLHPDHFEIAPRDLFDSLALDISAVRAQAIAFADDADFRSMWIAPLKFRKSLSGHARVAFDELFHAEIKAMHRRILKRMRGKHGNGNAKRARRVSVAPQAPRETDTETPGPGERAS